jgi:hypothetical protein
MSFRRYLLLALLGLSLSLLAARFQSAPGYMDADYYLMGGLQLARGEGFREWVLWNYLDDPQGLPHPSHTYWMPMASLLAAAGVWLTGGEGGFAGGRMGFLALTALLPPLTAALGYSLTRRRDSAALSGSLAAFSGFYLPFLLTTDTFGLYMLLGAVFLYLAHSERLAPLRLFSLGLIAGLIHLTRPDGLLWLFLALVVWVTKNRPRFHLLFLPLIGYFLVVSPWLYRNLQAYGALFPPGGLRALWFTEYNELFVYPPSLLTPAHLAQSGVGEILRARLWAFGQNLQTALAVQGSVFLAPLILWGLWRSRGRGVVQLGLLGWLLTLGAMTLLFPFAGARGGFFHSGAALQPLFWAVAPVGLEGFVEWGSRKRDWRRSQARAAFSVGLLTLALLLTGWIFWQRVIGSSQETPQWGESQRTYQRVEAVLRRLGVPSEAVVLVNNPPGYYLAAGRPAIVIPAGDVRTLREVAGRYRARYLILEANHPPQLDDLYAHPRHLPGLRYLRSVDSVHLFEIIPLG